MVMHVLLLSTLQEQEDRHRPAPEERRIASDVICVMVRVQDRSEREPLAIEVIDYGSRIAWVDHSCVAVVSDRPDVVVAERPYRNHLEPTHVRYSMKRTHRILAKPRTARPAR